MISRSLIIGFPLCKLDFFVSPSFGGVYFERKNEIGARRIGLIAQEVEEVLPEVVYTDSDGMKSVSYGSIIGLLIEAIKEQQEIIMQLK